MPILMIVFGLVVTGVVLLMLAALVLYLLGRSVPVEHEAASRITLNTSPEHAYAVIADISTYPAWAANTNLAERQPDSPSGHERWQLTMGRNKFILETTVSDPPRKLIRTIADARGPFSGAWEYTVAPAGEGCTVTLKEIGRIQSAIPRAVMKHMTGYHFYVNKHLESLGKKFGLTPVITKL